MRLLFLLTVGCVSATPGASPNETPEPEHVVGDHIAQEDMPLESEEPLRPEDAVGFAQMHPSVEDDECLAADELPEPSAWRIGSVHFVWLPCEVGAYQPTGGLFLVGDDGNVERLSLTHVAEDGTMLHRRTTGEFRLNVAEGTAEDLMRYRGLGDCGRLLRYRVGEHGLTLLEHRELSCELGQEGALPGDWPRRYPPSEDID